MTAKPSLENLIETENIGLEVFHPGGLEMTRELADLCHIGKGTRVLDVASGTGESACYLTETSGARVTGVDKSEYLLQRARDKAALRNLEIEFKWGDAQQLDLPDDSFEAAISECTLCLLDKKRALNEMIRVTKPGGYVGIHDVCWLPDTPDRLKEQLAELESERPETLIGWQTLFERAGLTNIQTSDRSSAIADWTRTIKRSLGVRGQLELFRKIWRSWGLSGVYRVMQSERIFRSRYTGYGIIVGLKKTTELAESP